MPDIQTEMQKILQAWEQPETTETTKETTVFKPTNNVTRSTFESVRDNPGLLKKEYIRKLEALGFKKASTSSLLSQMVRQGQIWVGSDGAMRPNAKEYTPIKSSKTMAKREAKVKKPKTFKLKTSTPSQESMGLAALALSHDVKPVRSKIEDILDNLSLSDAHELYRKLHLYFGGLGK
jgi:hypothetical protein